MGALATLFPAIFGSYGGVSDMRNPALWLEEAIIGRRTSAGESVTPETANTVSAYFACVRNVAEDVAKLPLLIYRKTSNGREKAKDHPAYPLMTEAPNPEMGAQSFRETAQACALGWHGGFAEIERDNAGRPLAMWPIHSSRVTVARVSGRLVYRIKGQCEVNGKQYAAVDLDPMNVFAIHGVGPDGLQGTSVLRAGAETIGISLALQKYRGAFFGNNTITGGVLTHPGKLSPEAVENLRRLWVSRHQGAENAGKPAILQEGITWEQDTVNPEDAQAVETSGMQIEEICRLFRMPPHMIQYLQRSTNNNIESQSRDYFWTALRAWLVRWEQEANKKLLSADDRAQGYYYEHLYTSFMMADLAAQTTHLDTMLKNGTYSPNIVLELLNMNTIGPEGDEHYIQGAMVTLKRVASGEAFAKPALLAPKEEPPEPPAKKPEPQDEFVAPEMAMLGVFTDIANRCVTREVKAIESLKKDGMTAKAFGQWATTFYAGHQDYLSDAYCATCEALAILIGKHTPYATMKQVVRAYCLRHATESQAMFAANLLADTCDLWKRNTIELALELVNAVKESSDAHP